MGIQFNRNCDEKLIENFKSIFKSNNEVIENIKNDINKGNAFFAFRPNDIIRLYYKGRKIFDIKKNTIFNNIKLNTNKTIILKNNVLNRNNYTNIKKQIDKIVKKHESGKSYREAYQTSALYKFSWCNAKVDYILLDIEPQFSYPKNEKENMKQSRVDAVLFDVKSKSMCFVEVKRIEDDRLKKGNKEYLKISNEIIKQLKEYENLVNKNRKLIFDEYEKVIRAINEIKGTNYSLVTSKKIELAFLVTEYDKARFSNEIKEFRIKMKKELETRNIKVKQWYIGNVFNATDNTLKKKWFKK